MPFDSGSWLCGVVGLVLAPQQLSLDLVFVSFALPGVALTEEQDSTYIPHHFFICLDFRTRRSSLSLQCPIPNQQCWKERVSASPSSKPSLLRHKPPKTCWLSGSRMRRTGHRLLHLHQLPSLQSWQRHVHLAQASTLQHRLTALVPRARRSCVRRTCTCARAPTTIQTTVTRSCAFFRT